MDRIMKLEDKIVHLSAERNTTVGALEYRITELEKALEIKRTGVMFGASSVPVHKCAECYEALARLDKSNRRIAELVKLVEKLQKQGLVSGEELKWIMQDEK